MMTGMVAVAFSHVLCIGLFFRLAQKSYALKKTQHIPIVSNKRHMTHDRHTTSSTTLNNYDEFRVLQLLLLQYAKYE